MKTVLKRIAIYEFNELSQKAKDKAIQEHSTMLDSYWYEYPISDMTDIALKIGIDIDNIYFSGFSSQGDGACFVGSYEYQKGALKTIKSEYPDWKELHSIVQDLQNLQSSNFYQLSAKVTQNDRYTNEYSAYSEVFRNGNECLNDSDCKALQDVMRDYMRLIYSQLESAYNYETSEAGFLECCEANNYQFLENGEFYNE